MTAKASQATPATSCPAPVVLFGIDSHGKPQGGLPQVCPKPSAPL